MTDLLGRGGEKARVLGDPQDRLGDAEGDDLGVGDPAAGVLGLARQEIVRHAINGDEECVEVGVHRGRLVDGEYLITADFGLSSPNPSITTPEAVPRNRLARMSAVE